MSSTAIIWIVVVVVVLLVLAFVAAKVTARQKDTRGRNEAGQIRQRAAAEEKDVRKHEAEAAEQEAVARQARAEADRKAAAADRQSIEAQERGEEASGKRAEHREHLRAADDLDPDVPDQRADDNRSDRGNDPGTTTAQRDPVERA